MITFDKKQLGQRLREARETAGISQVNCARMLNIARQTYLDMETGKTEPKAFILYEACSILDVNFLYVLTGIEGIPNLTKSDINIFLEQNSSSYSLRVVPNK